MKAGKAILSYQYQGEEGRSGAELQWEWAKKDRDSEHVQGEVEKWYLEDLGSAEAGLEMG